MSSKDKWVTFDCYGTLYDWQTGFRNILNPIAGDRTDELIRGFHRAEIEIETQFPTLPYREILARSITRSAEHAGYTLRDDDAGCLSRNWGSIPIFSDTGKALTELQADGWKLAVLTNCDDDLFTATEARFPVVLDMVVTAQQVKSYKPGLAHFETFERRSGVSRNRWVHAAVSWHHDMQAALKLDIKCVWVDRERTGHDPSIVTAHIHDMASLPATLRTFKDIS
jgi:2-haloacid dehalogenase